MRKREELLILYECSPSNRIWDNSLPMWAVMIIELCQIVNWDTVSFLSCCYVSSGQYCCVQPCHKEIFEIKNLPLWRWGCGCVKTPGVVDRNCRIGVVFTVCKNCKNGWLKVSQVGFHMNCVVLETLRTQKAFFYVNIKMEWNRTLFIAQSIFTDYHSVQCFNK